MKKYILTRYGIYEVVKEDDDEWVDVISNFERKMKCQCCIKKKSIIKQADTIEELCDEIVQVLSNGYHNQCLTSNYYQDMLTQKKVLFPSEMGADYYVNVIAIYGAIWTDKGLIYVAKMNDKGELELL